MFAGYGLDRRHVCRRRLMRDYRYPAGTARARGGGYDFGWGSRKVGLTHAQIEEKIRTGVPAARSSAGCLTVSRTLLPDPDQTACCLSISRSLLDTYLAVFCELLDSLSVQGLHTARSHTTTVAIGTQLSITIPLGNWPLTNENVPNNTGLTTCWHDSVSCPLSTRYWNFTEHSLPQKSRCIHNKIKVHTSPIFPYMHITSLEGVKYFIFCEKLEGGSWYAVTTVLVLYS